MPLSQKPFEMHIAQGLGYAKTSKAYIIKGHPILVDCHLSNLSSWI